MQFSELISEVRNAAGIDVDDAQNRIGRWINLAIRELATRSRWLKAAVEIGPSVAEQGPYTLPASVYEVEDLRVGDRHYIRVGTEQLQNAKAGLLAVRGAGGVFAPQFTSSGLRQIELYPAPTTGGSNIVATAVVYPNELTGSDELVQIPEEHHMAIVHKAIATGLSLADEHNDAAEYHESKFNAAIEALRRHTNMQVSGTVQQGLIAGIHY